MDVPSFSSHLIPLFLTGWDAACWAGERSTSDELSKYRLLSSIRPFLGELKSIPISRHFIKSCLITSLELFEFHLHFVLKLTKTRHIIFISVVFIFRHNESGFPSYTDAASKICKACFPHRALLLAETSIHFLFLLILPWKPPTCSVQECEERGIQQGIPCDWWETLTGNKTWTFLCICRETTSLCDKSAPAALRVSAWRE